MLERVRVKTGMKSASAISTIFSIITKYSISGSESKVLELALKEGLTVYDAAYLYTAAEKGLVLATGGEKLRAKASRYVKTMSTSDLLQRLQRGQPAQLF
ncbi:MAG: type II toxin-antitoxin system VapC family toxin [Desulfurococcaceae archaeon]